jgi:ketosteroid isomerase-like protein
MSQENVETVRRVLEAFDAGDRPTWLSLHDENHVVTPSDSWPEAGEVHGRDAAWAFYRDVIDAMPLRGADATLEAVSTDRVLVHQRHSTRGRASGADVVVDYWGREPALVAIPRKRRMPAGSAVRGSPMPGPHLDLLDLAGLEVDH